MDMSLRKRIVLFLGTTLILIGINHRILGLHAENIVFLNITPSIPVGLYVAIPTVSLRNGDIVAYEYLEVRDLSIKNGWLPSNAADIFFVKHIALPGSRYTIREDGTFYVNGAFIGMIAREDRMGHKLPVYPAGEYIVPEGMVLPYTKAGTSFDGRYFGPIPQEKIVHRIVPLITW